MHFMVFLANAVLLAVAVVYLFYLAAEQYSEWRGGGLMPKRKTPEEIQRELDIEEARQYGWEPVDYVFQTWYHMDHGDASEEEMLALMAKEKEKVDANGKPVDSHK